MSDFVIRKGGKLSQYNGKDKIVVVPEGVIQIGCGGSVFEKNDNIEEIVLPNSTSFIQEGALYFCESVKRIHMPMGLKKISNNSFPHCAKNLEDIIIPPSVEVIGNRVFEITEYAKLKKIYICDSIEKIGKNAFFAPKGDYEEEDDYFVVDAIIEINCDAGNVKSQKAIIDALRYETLAYSWLRNKLIANDNIIESVKKWVKAKANRKILIETAIRRSDVAVIAKLFEIVGKISADEMDGYIELANEKSEVKALLLASNEKVKPKSRGANLESDFKIELTAADYKKLFKIKYIEEGAIISGYKGKDKEVFIPSCIGKKAVVALTVKTMDDFIVNRVEKVYSSIFVPFPVGMRVDDCTSIEIVYAEEYTAPDCISIFNTEEIKIGNTISYGQYVSDVDEIPKPLQWKILEVKEGKALIITRDVIEILKYKENYHRISDEKWDESLLKYWLNGVFFKYVFSDNEKNKICSSYETGDKVFILNEKEIRAYDCLECERTKYVKAQCNRAWMEESYCRYWLRDGKVVDLTGSWCADSEEDMEKGNFYWNSKPRIYDMHLNKEHIMVRPAMWINLK